MERMSVSTGLYVKRTRGRDFLFGFKRSDTLRAAYTLFKAARCVHRITLHPWRGPENVNEKNQYRITILLLNLTKD